MLDALDDLYQRMIRKRMSQNDYQQDAASGQPEDITGIRGNPLPVPANTRLNLPNGGFPGFPVRLGENGQQPGVQRPSISDSLRNLRRRFSPYGE